MEEMTQSLFPDGINVYVENTKKINQKLLTLIRNYSKVSGYKINIVTFLYASKWKSQLLSYMPAKEQLEFEVKK